MRRKEGNFELSELRAGGPSSRRVIFPRGPMRLYVLPTSVGYDLSRDEPYDWHGLRRGQGEFVLFQYTMSGMGRLMFEERETVVPPGHAMLLRFPHNHRYWHLPGESWEFFWICITGREALRIWSAIIAAHGPVIKPPHQLVEHVGQVCQDLLTDANTSAGEASVLAYDVLMALFQNYLEYGMTVRSEKRSDAIRDAIAYARDNVTRPVSVDELSEVAGYSRSHFTRLFEESEGISPARYMLDLRLRRALRLLQETPSPIKEVSYLCGFRDPSYFAKAFFRTYGMAPSDVRMGRAADAWGGETAVADEAEHF